MSKKFEPKVPVELNPPKDDPISVEDLAKANGMYFDSLTEPPAAPYPYGEYKSSAAVRTHLRAARYTGFFWVCGAQRAFSSEFACVRKRSVYMTPSTSLLFSPNNSLQANTSANSKTGVDGAKCYVAIKVCLNCIPVTHRPASFHRPCA